MSDHIRLSLWFASQTKAQILPRLARAIEVLPAEAQERGVRDFSVAALSWSEPPLLDEHADEGVPVAAAVEQMREFVTDDCACALQLGWMLWTYEQGTWTQAPRTLEFTAVGPLFADGGESEGHLMVDFGLDEAFLAELAPWNDDTRRHLQANIIQLLVYCHRVQEALEPTRRRLWSEVEADWTQKLMRRLDSALDQPGAPA